MIGAYYLVRDLLVSLAPYWGAWLGNRAAGETFSGHAAFGLCGNIVYLLTIRRQKA